MKKRKEEQITEDCTSGNIYSLWKEKVEHRKKAFFSLSSFIGKQTQGIQGGKQPDVSR